MTHSFALSHILKTQHCYKTIFLIKVRYILTHLLPDFIGSLLSTFKVRGGKKIVGPVISKMMQAPFYILSCIYTLRLSMQLSPQKHAIILLKTFDRSRDEF